jgi:periplasmic divalent cation tolerance protein
LIFSENLIKHEVPFSIMILLYIPCKDKKEATNIAKVVVKKKFAACANIFPITSFYYWDKKLVEDNEVVLILKTSTDGYVDLEKEVKKLHSYDIPAIIKINAEANSEFENWVKENTLR